MIARIAGKLIESSLTRIIVDINGIGYQLLIPMSTYDKLPREGGDVALHTILQPREDALTLYGFATPTEKNLFELLTTVSGVGPKMALNVLSCMTPASFCAAIANADIRSLSKVSGVGKRLAERLIVELRGKVAEIAPEVAFGGAPTTEAARAAEDAMLALEQLGFKRDKARECLRGLLVKIPEREVTSENLIREALRLLNS